MNQFYYLLFILVGIPIGGILMVHVIFSVDLYWIK